MIKEELVTPELDKSDRAGRIPDDLTRYSEAAVVKKPSEIMRALGEIRDNYRKIMHSFRSSKPDLVNKMGEELKFTEKEATVEGVNFSKCQMDVLFAEMKSGRPLEFESFSPYLTDYNRKTGEIWEDRLVEADEIGLTIAKVLRAEFPAARMISLYDEYNSDLTDSSDARGLPLRDAPQLPISEPAKKKFKENIEILLQKRGIIGPDDVAGKNYLLISESAKVQDAEKLVARLEDADGKNYLQRDGELIKFVNPDAENPAYSEITLRTKNGRWLCEALDASSYLNPENLKISHLVILPDHFVKQQDRVWEILRVLGIKPNNYHNIFYNDKLPAEKVAAVIKQEIDKYRPA